MSHAAEHGHDEHAHADHGSHVNDNMATRFLGIVLALGIAFGLNSLATSMGWHSVTGGVLTGLSGVLLGATGSCVQKPNTAAIMGWAGGTNFFLGIALFLLLSKGVIG